MEQTPSLISLENMPKETLIAMVMHYRRKEMLNKEQNGRVGATPRSEAFPTSNLKPEPTPRSPPSSGESSPRTNRRNEFSPSKKTLGKNSDLDKSDRTSIRKAKKDDGYHRTKHHEKQSSSSSLNDQVYFGTCPTKEIKENLSKIIPGKLDVMEDEELINCSRKTENYNILNFDDADDDSPMFRRKLFKTEKNTLKFLNEMIIVSDNVIKSCMMGREYYIQMEQAFSNLQSMRQSHLLGFAGSVQKNFTKISTQLVAAQTAHLNMINELEEVCKDMKVNSNSLIKKICVSADTYKTEVEAYDEISNKYFKKVNLKNQKKLSEDLILANSKRKSSCESHIQLLNSIEMNDKLKFITSLTNISLNHSYCSKLSDFVPFEELIQCGEKLTMIQPIINTISKQNPESQIEIDLVSKCEKESKGHLYKAELKNGRLVNWSRNYYSIAYGYFIQSSVTPKGKIVKTRWNLLTCGAIKQNTDTDREFVFQLTLVVQGDADKPSSYETLLLQAESQEARDIWMANIQKTVSDLLESQTNGTDNSASSRKSTRAKIRTDILAKLFLQNPTCVDCDEKDPQWAAINMGSMMCINCSGKHRSLGTDISKVRSLKLDLWDYRTIKILQSISNSVVNKIYEHDLSSKTINSQSSSSEREEFIVAKYKSKQFVEKKLLSQEEHAAKLFECVVSNNPCLVLEQLAYCQNINTQDKEGYTPLHRAIVCQSYEVAQLLILNNADVHFPLGKLNLNSPIHTAAYQKDPVSIAILVNAGASIEKKNKDGETPESILKNCDDNLKSALLGFEPSDHLDIQEEEVSNPVFISPNPTIPSTLDMLFKKEEPTTTGPNTQKPKEAVILNNIENFQGGMNILKAFERFGMDDDDNQNK